MNWIINLLLGCTHKRTTFPITPKRREGWHSRRSAYVVCLDCGKEFEYSWEEMRIGKKVTNERPEKLTSARV